MKTIQLQSKIEKYINPSTSKNRMAWINTQFSKLDKLEKKISTHPPKI